MAVTIAVCAMFKEVGENQLPSYLTLFNEAQETFSKEYQAKFAGVPNEINLSSRDMASRKLAADETDTFKIRTGQAVLLENQYLEAKAALERIITVYKKTIEQCSPPSLDKSTILLLNRMGIEIKSIETQYTQLFQTSLSSLRDSLASIEVLKATLEKEWNQFDVAFAEGNAAMNHQGGFWDLFGRSQPFPVAAREEFRAQVRKQTSEVSVQPTPAT